ncbi:cell growth-regulating nucleolar protein [Aulostomus maculatus]
MVFFTCNACGESLKKAQVDKHVTMCRGCRVLSCIDCGKDFWGDDYKNHIKCISEDQKYGGKGFAAKANKGDVKQQQWIQRVHAAMDKPGVSAKLKEVLKQVSAYDNVPRKKAKFENWMRNSLKISNPSLHGEVWDILNTTADNPPDATQKPREVQETAAEVKVDTNGIAKQNGNADIKKKKLTKQERREARRQAAGKGPEEVVAQQPEVEQAVKKKKNRKRTHECEEDRNEDGVDEETSSKKIKVHQKTEAADLDVSEETEESAAPKGPFNWKGTIKAVLRESPNQELALKKLRKKVLAAYNSFTGDGNFKTKEEVLSLFNKKIEKNPKFRVVKDRVRLVNKA